MTAILAGMMVDDEGNTGEWRRKSSGEEEEWGVEFWCLHFRFDRLASSLPNMELTRSRPAESTSSIQLTLVIPLTESVLAERRGRKNVTRHQFDFVGSRCVLVGVDARELAM